MSKNYPAKPENRISDCTSQDCFVFDSLRITHELYYLKSNLLPADNRKVDKDSNELLKYLIVRYNDMGPYRINGLIKLEKNLLDDTLENRFINGQLIYTTPILRISYVFEKGKILEQTISHRIFKKQKECFNFRPLYSSNPNWPIYESYDMFGQLNKKGFYVLDYKVVFE